MYVCVSVCASVCVSNTWHSLIVYIKYEKKRLVTHGLLIKNVLCTFNWNALHSVEAYKMNITAIKPIYYTLSFIAVIFILYTSQLSVEQFNIYICICVCVMCVCLYMCVLCVCVSVYVSVYMYVYVSICVCVWVICVNKIC